MEMSRTRSSQWFSRPTSHRKDHPPADLEASDHEILDSIDLGDLELDEELDYSEHEKDEEKDFNRRHRRLSLSISGSNADALRMLPPPRIIDGTDSRGAEEPSSPLSCATTAVAATTPSLPSTFVSANSLVDEQDGESSSYEHA